VLLRSGESSHNESVRYAIRNHKGETQSIEISNQACSEEPRGALEVSRTRE
jgi:hypothetical protein